MTTADDTFGARLHNGHALVVGASQGIGLGFVKHLLADPRVERVYGTYRQIETAGGLLALADHPQLVCLLLDATDEAQIAATTALIQTRSDCLDLVINCVGFLHTATIQPEKSLRQINADHLLQYFQVNSIPTVLLAKYLLPLLKASSASVFTTISAKIGSIGDNNFGGWYGYRASKAALNMFLKTIAIEYHRKSPHTIVAALHPGTTATRLSAPFHRTVPPEKLFPPARTVQQLMAVIDSLTETNSGEFFSWDGSPLPW